MNSRSKGMTLLEVLMALVILATVSISVILVSTQSTVNIGYLQYQFWASIVADNQLNLIKLEHTLLEKPLSGTTELANHKWYWEVAPENGQNGDIQIWQIHIFLDKGHSKQILTRTTYVSDVTK